MSIFITILLTIWMIVALLMVLVILMQRPKSEGLGAAFGGGVTENIFGAQTTNVLVKFTAYLAAIFFVVTFVLSILYAKQASGNSALRQELMKTQAGAQPSVTPGATQPSPAASVPAGSPTPATAASASVAPSSSLPPATPAADVVPPVSAPVAPSVAPTASPSARSHGKRRP